jgi:hypothetical protein
MNREDFRSISAHLQKGSKVHVRLAQPQLTCPIEFTAKIHDSGPSYIEVGIKGTRGLRRFLFTQIESIQTEMSNQKTC